MASTIDVGDWLSADRPCNPSQRCGLFISGDVAKALPLRSRAVSATVYAEHGFCEVQEQLAYVSDEDCTVRFVFPLPPRSAVYKFEATIGDRKIVTEVKRKAAAQEEYDTAVRQGHSAVHMAQQAGASLYSVDVGNLCAMEEALITFCYVRLLNSVAGAVEFEHQATWVPPYLKAAELDAAGKPEKEVARANPVFADRVSYKLSYDIKVQSSRGFKSIESPTPLTIKEEAPHVRIVTLEESVSEPSRDLTLLVELPALPEDQSDTGQLLLQECDRQGGKKRKIVALATFIPRLPKSQTEVGQQAAREIVFVVDGSGSMGGSPIQQALEAALFFVKDLPTSGAITFNAAMFGSGHQLMWPASKPYTEAAQQDATKWLQANVNANWGGTEVLSVLQAIYAMPLPKSAEGAPAASRQIIFLTDGGVSGGEEEAVYNLVQGNSGSAATKAAAARTSIYSLGIGHGVHRGLVEGVATKTGGMAQFVVDGEAIGKKAGLLKRCALAAEGGCLMKPRLVTRSCMVKAAPNVLPPRLFPDEPLHMLVKVVKSEPGASLDLTATLPGQEAKGDGAFSISLSLDKAVHVPGDVFAVLHAMCSIGGLLGGTSELHCRTDGTTLPNQPTARQVEDAVVALAEEEGLVTPHTSAVGVLLQQDPLDPDSVRSVQVPLQVPAGRDMWKAGQQQQQQQQHFGMMRGGRGGGVMAAAGGIMGRAFNMAGTPPPPAASFFGGGGQPMQPSFACAAPVPCAASGSFTLFSAAASPAFGSVPLGASQSGQVQAVPFACSMAASAPAFGSVSFGASQSGQAQAVPFACSMAASAPAFGSVPFGASQSGQAQAVPFACSMAASAPAFGSVPFGASQSGQAQAVPFACSMAASAPAFGSVPFGASQSGQAQAVPFACSMAASAPAFGSVPLGASPSGQAQAVPFGGSMAAAAQPVLFGGAPEKSAVARAQECCQEEGAEKGDMGLSLFDNDDMEVDEQQKQSVVTCENDQDAGLQGQRSSQSKKERRRDCSRSRSPSGRAHVSVLAPDQVLPLLNLRRTAQGNVAVSEEVLQALAGQAYKQQQEGATPAAGSLADAASALLTASARPAALTSDDAWVMLLALAYLRKYLASEQGVWSGLEAKALEWLAGVWPSDLSRSPGSLVLAAIKLV